MPLRYCVIETYSSEESRWRGKPLWQAVLDHVAKSRVGARCLVFRGMAGCYESGELSSAHLEVLSYNMPVKVEIVLPAGECGRLVSELELMVVDGIITVREATVAVHRVHRRLVPRQLRVRDVMSAPATTVTPATPVSDVIRVLLTADFNAVPVVDEERRPVGIITQGDLIERAGMPIRLGLLAELDAPQLDEYLRTIGGLTAAQVMTSPAVTADADKRLDRLVQLMLKRRLKRLPVVDKQGRLVGMVARLDVFGIIVDEMAETRSLVARDVHVGGVAAVRDVMTRERDTVLPQASGAEVLELMRRRDVQRVAVVDEAGVLRGLVTDLDLLTALSAGIGGLWSYLSRPRDLAQVAGSRTAAQIMKTDLITVTEETPVDEAIRTMAMHGLKRLPVVDEEGRYQGMVSRQAVLGAGAAGDALDAV